MNNSSQTTHLLDGLNERQREAVLATEGPVLVLAGAGTGKTRVITYRVAHLIEKGVPGNAILAVTFTNKAAGVMKDRIGELLRSTGRQGFDVWVSTFHSFCARFLRREFQHLGLPRDFAIFDDDDQTAAVKRAMQQLGLSTDDFSPRSVRSQISHAKNHGISPDEMEAEAGKMRDDTRKQVSEVFRVYNEILRKSAALDFDDLLSADRSDSARSRRRARRVELAIPIFDGGRISGHQCLAGRAGPPARRDPQKRLRCGRRGPIHLWVARGARREPEALHGGLPFRAS